jgi:hypothetical protein
MACETELAAMNAAEAALDVANADWWEAGLNLVGAGICTAASGAGFVIGAIAEIPTLGTVTPLTAAAGAGALGGAAWTASAAIGMSQADDTYDTLEDAYDAAEAAYCACMGL